MILHICRKSDWQAAQYQGEYRAASLAAEGFIHCSTPSQVLSVANAFYRGYSDLVLLWIDSQKVAAEIRWELPTRMDSAHGDAAASTQTGERFPHIYGPLNLNAVMRAVDFSPDPDGVFRRIPPS